MIHDFIVLEPETKCVGRKIEYVPIIVEDEAVAASAASIGIHVVEEREGLLSIHADGRRIMMPSSQAGTSAAWNSVHFAPSNGIFSVRFR